MPQDQESDRSRRRMPSVEKRISEIRPGDMRVRLIGTVVDRQENRMVLDDGSGRINVSFDSSLQAKPNQFVRVFGRVVDTGNGLEVEGEIVQDMEKLDKDLYKKINSLKLDNY